MCKKRTKSSYLLLFANLAMVSGECIFSFKCTAAKYLLCRLLMLYFVYTQRYMCIFVMWRISGENIFRICPCTVRLAVYCSAISVAENLWLCHCALFYVCMYVLRIREFWLCFPKIKTPAGELGWRKCFLVILSFSKILLCKHVGKFCFVWSPANENFAYPLWNINTGTSILKRFKIFLSSKREPILQHSPSGSFREFGV